MVALIKNVLLFLNAVFRHDTAAKVVFYHDIGTEYTEMGTPEVVFRAHLACLKGRRGVNFHTVAFDDGFRGVWDHRETLKSFGVSPIVFIVVGLVGRPGYLTWDEMRTLKRDYGFEFQCHTWSHQTLVGPVNADLPRPEQDDFRTDDWYRHELVDSKAELERQLGCEVSALCFPVGYFSDDVVRRGAAAGYSRFYASFPGNRSEGDLAPRIVPRCLCQHLSPFAFKCVLDGGMNPLRYRYLSRQYLSGEVYGGVKC